MSRTTGTKYWDRPVSRGDITHATEVKAARSDTMLACDDCGLGSAAGAWTVGFAGCEICGDHDAICCPWCGWAHDGIFSIPKVMS